MAYSVPATSTLDMPILQALTASSSTQLHPLGYTTKSSSGREFVYCITSTGTTAGVVAGYPAFVYPTTTGWTVTADFTDCATHGGGFVGVFCCAVTAAAAAHYLWVQTKGLAPDAVVSTNIAVCNNLRAKSSVGFELLAYDAGVSGRILATALETDTAGLADIWIY